MVGDFFYVGLKNPRNEAMVYDYFLLPLQGNGNGNSHISLIRHSARARARAQRKDISATEPY